MTWPNRDLLVGVLLVFLPFLVLGQDITNLTYKLAGEKIEISYNLSGKTSDRYKVTLYNSIDKYAAPVKLVTGDIGENIAPGKGKKIIWAAKTELGEFKGGLALKLKTLFVPFITFSITGGQKFVMGKTNEVSWEGNATMVKLELYQGNKKIADIATARDGHHYDWQLAKKSFEKGSNYKIKGSANGREEFSEVFTLKNKIPVYMYFIPVAVIGGVIIATQIGKPQPPDNSIPPPIKPDGN